MPIGEPTPFKSPELAAEFIKEIAHRFGATLVGITKTNPDFLYSEGWAGCPDDYDFSKMPEHWEYSIVIGVPMEWDVILASPQASTSYDGYDRVSTAAVRLEGALKSLGYPARNHAPMTSYDLIVPPLAVEAGLGEVSRPGYCVTPELGSNCRTAVVTTNLPMATDKPIHFGVEEFCNKCKLCAESCPSGAIPMDDSPEGMVIRGYEHWYINNGACYNYWRESMGPDGMSTVRGRLSLQPQGQLDSRRRPRGRPPRSHRRGQHRLAVASEELLRLSRGGRVPTPAGRSLRKLSTRA